MTSGAGRTADLQCCHRRLEYLSSRLQDLALELGDGRGAVWLKENMWFLKRPPQYFDDVLYSVGKICNHLVSYLTLHKARLVSSFPFMSYMGILYEVGEIFGIVRDMLLLNPRETLSVKQSQIELFWTDCTPFIFVFENSNHLLLSSNETPVYIQALLDLVPVVIQVGMCMYTAPEAQLRGFDCFAETCIRLSKALVEPSSFLNQAEKMEPVIVPFLRQWIIFALELVQNGVKVRTDMTMKPPLSSRLSEQLTSARQERNFRSSDHMENTVPKTLNVLSLSNDSSLPDEVAESTLAPLKVRNSCRVRASCQPFRWIDVARTRVSPCPNEMRKVVIEEISLKENQKIISDIFLLRGKQPETWKGIKVHCPLTKSYDELKLKLFVKVKVGEEWRPLDAQYDKRFGKGNFLVFSGCRMEAFVAIEERPMTSRQVGPEGGRLMTTYNNNIEAVVPPGTNSKQHRVTMMVQPLDGPQERQYRAFCPEDFRHITSASPAVEIDGAPVERKISIKIPFNALADQNTKILVLKYTNEKLEVVDGEGLLHLSSDNVYTVDNTSNGGTMLASVDSQSYTAGTEANIRREMEVILGRKQLCKLLLFVENQQTVHQAENLNEIVLNVVCTEKFRVPEVVRDKSKVGMIELPKSQSPDRLLQQADEIKLEIKGSVSLDPDIPEDAYTLTYLEGSDNYVRFPIRIADCNGRITFVLRLGRDNSVLHTFFCNVQDILALLVQGYIAQSPVHSPDQDDEVFHFSEGLTPLSRESTSSELIEEDPSLALDQMREASLKILNRNSLVNLAKQVKNDESHLLGVCLGLKPEKLSNIYRTYRHSASLASFYVLYEWRGRTTQADLADRLIQALKDIGRRDLAQILTDVRQSNRGLSAEDFEHLRTDIRRKSHNTRRS
ncbi:uncharacterized protein LOC128219927 isoform X2 [Mya arenaria]|uniref:uncharacterized protein LOC128219927 isoform X2 n=1 Tax=Mya arenaria TaxID=6604 RepID=UPI0022E32B2D|nr:uncharacterized protein LOC128219927 isoform X2 [Mya arenaria]